MNAPLREMDAYQRPAAAPGVDLRLDGNEGAAPGFEPLLAAVAALGPEPLRTYPDAGALERAIATRFGVAPERVLVTAGADDALDRCCRAFLAPGREFLINDPSFEMLARFGRVAGGDLRRVPWTPGPFPIDPMCAAVGPRTALIAVVSPNNPTGEVARAADLARLASAAPGAMLVLDHAYVEYADEDLTADALALDNVVVTRTFSKAWGLAGCRVGYAIGSARAIAALRAVGGPYPVAAPSLAIAATRLATGDAAMRAHVARVRAARDALAARLAALGAPPRHSQANFLHLELGARSGFVHRALASRGIQVRRFADGAAAGALRLTLPDDSAALARLERALELALAPQALLLDMDGVLADVERSYRACVLAVAHDLGVPATREDVLRETLRGDANDEWRLTWRLLERAGVRITLAEATARFQARYLGTADRVGLREREALIPSPTTLRALAARLPLAVVTGRPRAEAEWFLERMGIADAFGVVVTREDAPAKPDPAPVRAALRALGVERAWFIGDTPDDARAARGADALALGVIAPGDDPDRMAPALEAAGAALVLPSLDILTELIR